MPTVTVVGAGMDTAAIQAVESDGHLLNVSATEVEFETEQVDDTTTSGDPEQEAVIENAYYTGDLFPMDETNPQRAVSFTVEFDFTFFHGENFRLQIRGEDATDPTFWWTIASVSYTGASLGMAVFGKSFTYSPSGTPPPDFVEGVPIHGVISWDLAADAGTVTLTQGAIEASQTLTGTTSAPDPIVRTFVQFYVGVGVSYGPTAGSGNPGWTPTGTVVGECTSLVATWEDDAPLDIACDGVAAALPTTVALEAIGAGSGGVPGSGPHAWGDVTVRVNCCECPVCVEEPPLPADPCVQSPVMPATMGMRRKRGAV